MKVRRFLPRVPAPAACAGCGKPERAKSFFEPGLSVFGVRRAYRRLRVVLVPNVVAVDRTHPRSAPKERRHAAYARLCRACCKDAG